MAYLIIDTNNRVAGSKFIAVPPVLQQKMRLAALCEAQLTIDGEPTKTFALGYSEKTLSSDVLVENKEGELVTMKY